MVGMDFVPGRNCLASLSFSGQFRLLDTVSFEESFKVKLHAVTLPRRSKIKDGSVATVRLSPDGQVAVLHFDKGSRAGWGSPCQLWDLTRNEELALVFVDVVYTVTFSSEDSLVAIDALKLCPCTYILDTTTGEVLQHLEWMNGLTFHPSANMFALIASDSNIAVWETAPLHERFRLEADQNVEKLAISPTGKLAAVLPNGGGVTSMIHLWDLSTRQMLGKWEINGGLSSLWFLTDGNFLGSNMGRLPLPLEPIEVGEEMIEEDLQSCFYVSNEWVFQGREQLIWLPTSYQVLDEDRVDMSRVDVRGNAIAFAHSGDSLKFIQIDLDNTPVAKRYKRKL
jgi:WD40 repeat protein